mgnify:CR=1 FL=1
MALIWVIAGILVLTTLSVAFLNLAGLFLQPNYQLHATNSSVKPLGKVLEVITNPKSYPGWRGDIVKTELDPNSWKEYFNSDDSVTFTVQEKSDKRFSVKLDDPKFPVVLERTYELWEQDYLSFLTIRDSIHYKKPYLRTLAYLFFDHSQLLQKTLKGLDSYLKTPSK